MSSNRITQNQREILAAQSTITGKSEYLTSTNQALNVNATVSISGSPIPVSGATTAIVTAIVDGSGNQITSFGGGTQYTDGGVPPTHPVGNTIEWSDGSNWQTVSTAKPLPVSASFSPSGTQDINLKQINGNTTSVGNGTAGTGVQRVTIASDNTAFSVNATLSAETTKVIGTVNQGTSPWIVAGGGSAGTAATGVVTVQGIASMTKLLVTPDANSAINVAQINGVTPLMGNGGTGTGSQRVTIASDNTAFSVNATLSAETTKVIGVTRTADGSGNLITSTGNALDINIKSGFGTSIAVTNAGTFAVQDTVLDAALISQETTTSGVKGLTVFGAVTTAKPTYTTAKSDALSLDVNGLLRVSLADTPANTNKLLVTADAITVAASQTIAVTNTGTFAVQADTELPAVAALGDGVANPTTTTVGAFGSTFNGSTWDRISGGNRFGDGGSATGAVLGAQLLYNGSSFDRARGVSGAANVNLTPTASGGWTAYALGNTTNAALTTTQTVSAAAGKFGGYMTLINLNSSPAYIQVFDTTGAVTLGTTAPIFVIAIPANSTAANGVAANMEVTNGLVIANGIKIAATTTSNGASTVATGITGTIIFR